MLNFKKYVVLSSLLLVMPVYAATLTVPVYKTQEKGQGAKLGEVTFEDTQYGLEIKPQLAGLPTGTHGFHIHVNPDCDNNGLAAGGHFDPAKSDEHEGPYQQGHLGDLPVLVVNQQGEAALPGIAPRLKVEDLIGHAVIIHVGGDNYSDHPEKLGGGGARFACGVIKKS